MATQELTGVQQRADHAGDTAPLPAAALPALARLHAAFPVVQAVTVYETAAVHAVQLAALAEAGPLSDLDADSLAHAEDLMAGARATLASAGRLDLIDPLHAKAAEYYALAAVVDRLSSRESHYMTSSDWQEVYAAQEEQTRLHFELKRAGRLDLIGGA